MLLEDEAIVKTLLQRLEPRQEKRRAGSVEFLAGQVSAGTKASIVSASVLTHWEKGPYLSMTSHEVIERLEADGWVRLRQKGSHIQFGHRTKKAECRYLTRRKDMTMRTIKSIEKQSGLKLL